MSQSAALSAPVTLSTAILREAKLKCCLLDIRSKSLANHAMWLVGAMSLHHRALALAQVRTLHRPHTAQPSHLRGLIWCRASEQRRGSRATCALCTAPRDLGGREPRGAEQALGPTNSGS